MSYLYRYIRTKNSEKVSKGKIEMKFRDGSAWYEHSDKQRKFKYIEKRQKIFFMKFFWTYTVQVLQLCLVQRQIFQI